MHFTDTVFVGVIVAARNVETQELAAIKLEAVDPTKQVLKLEVSTLKKLQSMCKSFPFKSTLYLVH